MEILPVSADNLDDCINIFIQAYNTPPWNYNWTPENARQYLLEYMDNSGFIGFILYDGSVGIGAVLAHKKTWWTNQQLIIDEFFISPVKQRMGYGKKLMDFCNDYARKNQIELLVLMTNKYMPSYKFYNKIDYTTTEQYVFMFRQV